MVPRDRRAGPSRLSTWSGRRVAFLWIAWPGIVLALVLLGAALSVVMHHGLEEVRLDMSRFNLIFLGAVLGFPPVWLTLQWWRMHARRHRRVEPETPPA